MVSNLSLTFGQARTHRRNGAKRAWRDSKREVLHATPDLMMEACATGMASQEKVFCKTKDWMARPENQLGKKTALPNS